MRRDAGIEVCLQNKGVTAIYERRPHMVIAIDKNKRPVGFVTERRARILMEKRRACLYRVFPAVMILKDIDSRTIDTLPTHRIKIDPGSKHTGIAVICNETDEVMFFMQIEHRGDTVHENKMTQKNSRRNRRNRETPYRRCKYRKGEYDSARKEGWLPPTVKSVADNVINWVKKLSGFIRITECSFEAVRFDTQLMDDPDIEGIEYQHGELFGYEMKEYLIDKYGHECQYCHGASGDDILEWEHKLPKSRNGSDSTKNATLACRSCNEEKDTMTPEEWNRKLLSSPQLDDMRRKKKADLTKKEALLLARAEGTENVMKGAVKKSDRYCAWVNSTRRYIERFLFEKFGDVECSSGGRTKYNRIQVLGLPKDHHYDALCVGKVPEGGYTDRTNGYVLYAKAIGRGTRLIGQINECGIIDVKYRDHHKRVGNLQTGDIVHVIIPNGKYTGEYTGRIMTRASGSHDVRTIEGELVTGTKKSEYRILQHTDGYSYRYAIA